MPTGIYVSIPFCNVKCSFCNFASGAFPQSMQKPYLERVFGDMAATPQLAREMGATYDAMVDTIYLGGGTPSTLPVASMDELFRNLRETFEVASDAEITVECAPGTLSDPVIACMAKNGVNRASLGVQSFVHAESSSVGRTHTREVVLSEMAKLRQAGIENISLDLIAGLPHQTTESWRTSLDETISSGAQHVSVYMLEIDDESRLGRELQAGGSRYHAHHVPDAELAAEFYVEAVERLNAAGIRQYEISNFAKTGFESRHNLKYWTRQPYLGFGLDAHSMLKASGAGDGAAVRWNTSDDLGAYINGARTSSHEVLRGEALEEALFLGLRMNDGVRLDELAAQFGEEAVAMSLAALAVSREQGLVRLTDDVLALTERGRLYSNEVFAQVIAAPQAAMQAGDLLKDRAVT